jgi:hypothetical protein
MAGRMDAAHAASRRSTVFTAVVLFPLCFAVYFGVGRYYLVLDAYPNELLPEAVIRHRSLTFDAYFDPAAPNLPFCLARPGNHVISYYPIVPGLLNIPAYLVARAAGVSFDVLANRQVVAKATTAWTSAASVALLYLTLVRLLPAARGHRPAVGFALFYAFGTCLWPIGSQALWQHGPALMFFTAALACLVRPVSRFFPLAGFLLGMAFWNRPSDLLLVLPLGLYVVLHHRTRLLAFATAAGPPVLAMALYSQIYWGSLAALGQGHRSSGVFLGSPYHLHGPILAGLAGILFSPARGLFVFTPAFLFAMPELARSLLRPRDPLLRYLCLGALGSVALVAKINLWWGGHSFGYRYLVDTVPVFTVLLAVGWCHWPQSGRARRLLWAGFLPLALIGLYIQFLGAAYFPCGWNATPVDVDRAPERLWDWRDTEIGRCHRRFLADARTALAPGAPQP